MRDYFDTLTWRGNSRAMLDAVINGAPTLFRGLLANMIKSWAQAQNLTVIGEADVFRAVDELAPAPMAETVILPELETLRTK